MKTKNKININSGIMKKSISLFILSLIFSVMSFSQTMTVRLDSIVADVGDSITVPVYFDNMNNLGSITLYIQYSNYALSYGGAQNWYPTLLNGQPLINASNGMVIISWADVNSVNVNGSLVELRFQFNGGVSSLNFTVDCEITDNVETIINPVYENGIVVQTLGVNATATQTVICGGSNTTLYAQGSNGFGNYTYQWSSVPAGFTSTLPSPIVAPTVSTTYSVIVSDGVNTASGSVFIEIFSNPPPTVITGMLPLDASIDLGRPFEFSWLPALNAISYDLYLWLDGDPVPTNPLANSLTQISYSHNANLQFGSTYHWQVIAKNTCYETPGPVNSFMTRFLPDVVVADVQLPAAAYSGQNFSVSWEVNNQGTGSTAGSNWIDKVYLSTDTTFEVNVDLYLGSVGNLSYLAPGQSYLQTASFILPQGISGNYYVFVYTDKNLHLLESDETNNSSFNTVPMLVSLTPPPDLQVTSIITPNNIFSGLSINVSWEVTNMGAGSSVSNYWQDRIYLTTDLVLNTANAINMGSHLHNGVLDADSSYTNTQSFTIPANIFGTYYVFIKTDVYDQVYEHATENNNVTRSDSIVVFLTPPPDLFVYQLNVLPIISNSENVQVSWIGINQGGSATSSWFRDKLYMSADPVLDVNTAIYLGQQYQSGALNPGVTYTGQLSVTIPSVSGTWFFYVVTDCYDQVFEYLNENNNITQSIPVVINNPDLIVTEVIIPPVDNTGLPFVIQWTTKNIGIGDVLNSSWNERLFLSYNEEFFPDSVTQIGNLSLATDLLSGDSIINTLSVSLPDFIPGPYYIYAYSDFTNGVFEGGNENNNHLRSIATIEIQRPDLIVSQVLSPPSAFSGQPIVIDWVVKNIGPAILDLSEWTEKLMYSHSAEYYSDSVINILSITYSGLIFPGDSILFSETINLPNGITGEYYLAVYTDSENVIFENGNENNNIGISILPMIVNLGPSPDLQILGITHPDSAVAGANIPLTFDIVNLGTLYADSSWVDNIYLSNSPVWNINSATSLRSVNRGLPLAINDAYNIITNVNLPANLTTGFYYLFVFTDADNNVYEHLDEFNNVQQFDPIFINQYPPVDLDITSFVATDSVMSGQSIPVSWQVENIGLAGTLASFWFDAVYLSADTFWNASTDILLDDWQENGPVIPGGTYSGNETVTIPNGLSGHYYLIVVTDKSDLNNDADYSNNVHVLTGTGGFAQSTYITLTPSPDLIVSSLVSPALGTSGQPVSVIWTVENTGVGPTTVSGWTDRFYLSTDFTINSGDMLIKTFSRTGIMLPGETSIDTVEIFLPISASGNYIMIVKTDVNNVVYEYMAENNNTANTFITVFQPPPADLIVSGITVPATGVAGDQITIDWTIFNNGLNPANGTMKDIVYLSSDTIWDINDILFGTVSGNISINPLGTLNRSLNSDLNNVSIGDYYAIVKTDIQNNIYESDDDNNSAFSVDTLTVDVDELFIDVLTPDTLYDSKDLYYRIEIPANLINETLLLTLKGDSINGNNELYIKYGDMPTRVDYDFSHDNPFLGNQELLIPNLIEGTYYILVFGNTTAGNQQNITLLAEILDFEIRSVDADIGGNTGFVTIKMRGSKFNESMDIRLLSITDTIEATEIHYIDPTTVFSTFDLSGATLGLYDVVADAVLFIPVYMTLDSVTVVSYDNLLELTTSLVNGFEVIEGFASDLQVNVIQPANARTNAVVTMSIEFTNAGNVDIVASSLIVESLAGSPLSFTVSGLTDLLSELEIFLFEPNGPPDILRPGVSGSITIYSKSTDGLSFSITLPNNY